MLWSLDKKTDKKIYRDCHHAVRNAHVRLDSCFYQHLKQKSHECPWGMNSRTSWEQKSSKWNEPSTAQGPYKKFIKSAVSGGMNEFSAALLFLYGVIQSRYELQKVLADATSSASPWQGPKHRWRWIFPARGEWTVTAGQANAACSCQGSQRAPLQLEEAAIWLSGAKWTWVIKYWRHEGGILTIICHDAAATAVTGKTLPRVAHWRWKRRHRVNR